MLKQKISGLLVTFALVLLIGSTVFPHHHHGNALCFSSKCVESCCHHDDEEAESEGIVSHHHNHTSDETVLYAPYTLAEHPKIISETAVDYHLLLVTADFDVPSQLRLSSPAVVWLFSDPGGTVPRIADGSPSSHGRRGPPVV